MVLFDLDWVSCGGDVKSLEISTGLAFWITISAYINQEMSIEK